MAQFPVNSPCQLPLIHPFYLLGIPHSVWCDPCPPWSQVACKLTSPSPFPPHSLFPLPNGFPNSIVHPSKTTSRHRLHLVRNMCIYEGKFSASLFWTAEKRLVEQRCCCMLQGGEVGMTVQGNIWPGLNICLCTVKWLAKVRYDLVS
jgi:hypothetical protein